jgi:hypothetical protein
VGNTTVNCPTTKTAIPIRRRESVESVKQTYMSLDMKFSNKGRKSVAADINSCGQPIGGGSTAWEVTKNIFATNEQGLTPP